MKALFVAESGVPPQYRTGPLAAHIDSFAAQLSEQGYACSTADDHLRLVAGLSRWLERHDVGVEDLDERKLVQFIEYRRQHQRLVCRSKLAVLRALLEHLRRSGAAPASAPAEQELSPLGRVEDGFRRYLKEERGLSPSTLLHQLPVARQFLVDRFGSGAILLEDLRPGDVTAFILRNARSRSPGRAKLMVGALRSFLRYLRVRGDIALDLAAVVPSVPDWRLAHLPKSIAPDEVERLLRAVDRSHPTGQRDYAVLLLLARLGLRAGEVVAMMLEDIDWEGGELLIRGKGGQQDRLPLLQDVGQALASYLREARPRCATRRVFVTMKAPRRGFAGPVAVCTIVRHALQLADLHPPRKGAHLLRHSLATGMLRHGASLAEIGEILRHRLPNTTQIYAKVDLDALRAIAPPWPGGAK